MERNPSAPRRKLKLEVDDLQVSTFQAEDGSQERYEGTVVAHAVRKGGAALRTFGDFCDTAGWTCNDECPSAHRSDCSACIYCPY